MRVFKTLTATALALTTLVLAGAPAGAQQKVVIFSAGPTGGTWTPMAAATADVVKKKYTDLDVQVEPGAALINIEKMQIGRAHV